MKTERDYPQISISKKGEKWLKNSQMWLYRSDVINLDETIENGSLVDIVTLKGHYQGTGFISLNSQILVRILSKDANEKFDRSFYKRRIQYAVDYRYTVMPDDTKACRLIFGESDQLPGLTVDRFNDVLVTQIVSYGMEKIKDVIYELLLEVLEEKGEKIRGIYERNDVDIRLKEGLELEKKWWKKPEDASTTTVIEENGLKISVDFENGQKTGYFLDQKNNRMILQKMASGKSVLDCFTHTGGFALNAAFGKASKVTAVDVSENALEKARENAKLNGLDIDFVKADVFEFLEQVNKKQYDIIVLDPPAFTKSRKTADHAYNGYLQINTKAMQLLGRGGYLLTCSCSHFMPYQRFEEMLKEAAFKAGVNLKQISVSQQNCDHPVIWNMPETDYLKFYVFQIF
ncbi:MAG: class I SAM-dependent rRNA methyltransferase [Erysipelotrichaceae bacterium]|nr:class I SAM-dependent rRNA methyltransferase [Erysipelotrichaceae bacterium]